MCTCSVVSLVSDSLWCYGQQPISLLCPLNSPSKNTGVGSHSLLRLVAMVFPVVMYRYESWTIKKTERQRIDELLSFWTEVLEKTIESPLDSKEIRPVHPKRNQSWTFIGGTDVEAETPILWPPDAKNWLIWRDPVAGKDWRQKRRGLDGWMVSLTEWTWVDISSGSSWCVSLVCCSPWGYKESDTTERMNWTEFCFTTDTKRFWVL